MIAGHFLASKGMRCMCISVARMAYGICWLLLVSGLPWLMAWEQLAELGSTKLGVDTKEKPASFCRKRSRQKVPNVLQTCESFRRIQHRVLPMSTSDKLF